MIFESEQKRRYEIQVHYPDVPAPSTGYPVIYVLDGNAWSHTLYEAVRLQSRRAEKTGVNPAVIVGIGYPETMDFHPRRVFDFTPPGQKLELPLRPNGRPWPEAGGAKEFMAFLEHRIKPAIEEKYAVDPEKQTLFGHSLGGLFVLYAFFTNHQMFRSYMACSPSIWWNNQDIIKAEKVFASSKAKARMKACAPLFLTVGSLEKDHMVKDARELAARLTGYGCRTDFIEALGENHMSVVPAVISRALRFINGFYEKEDNAISKRKQAAE
ncbi:alpha/beta hydrolase [Bacillus massiliglaciei]|uniref:alpha/beta hydrolase n=1 Tax=Bacillus massiliglaciei TaxID=1816693 RepID=UPI003899269A